MKIIPYRPDLNQEYYNPFKEKGIYPFCEIGRCITNKDTGEIKRWCHELDSTLDRDGNDIAFDKETEDYMVYIPAFYYKRVWEGDVLKDSILTRVPDTVEYEGYKVHPAFIKKDGTIRKYFLISAFYGNEYKKQLRSIPDVAQHWNIYHNITHIRDRALNGRVLGYGLINIFSLDALRKLFKISMVSQDVNPIGLGRSINQISKCGETLNLGNITGCQIYSNQTTFFGIEDLFSYNTNLLRVDGIYKINNEIFVTKNIEDIGDVSLYEKTGFLITESDGYINKIYKENNFIIDIPLECKGQKTSHYCSRVENRITSTGDTQIYSVKTFGDLSGFDVRESLTGYSHYQSAHFIYAEP